MKTLHPLAARALLFFGEVGLRAAAEAIDSVLGDVENVATEATNRTKRARARLRRAAKERHRG